MDVICLETEAFYALVEEVVARIREKDEIDEDKWIMGDQVMEMLGIKSRSTLQKFRDKEKPLLIANCSINPTFASLLPHQSSRLRHQE